MINISNSKHLDIILPNTNKALAEVIKSASPKELASIVQGKDLKSVLSTLLQKSANNPTMDKELLQLVKNNPTLKNLGDVTTTIKDLLKAIQADKSPTQIASTDLKHTESKQKLENSGAIVESKTKDIKNPIVELRNTLESLLKTLKPSDIGAQKEIPKQIQELLRSDILKNTSLATLKNLPATAIKQMDSELQILVNKLQNSLKVTDTINTPVIQKAHEKLQNFLEQKVFTSPQPKEQIAQEKTPLSSQKIETLQNHKEIVRKETTSQNRTPLAIEKVLTNLLTDVKDLKNTELKQKLENSGVFLESKLKDVKNPLVELKSTLESLLKELKSSNIAVQKEIPKQIQELLQNKALTNVTPSTLKELPTTLLKQIASEVQTIVEKLQTQIKSADTIHSPVIQKALDKLQHLLDPKVITPQSSAKELIDLKTLSAENFKLSAIKEPLEQIAIQMQKSFSADSKGILGALEKIFAALKTIEQSALTPKASLEQFVAKNIPQEIGKLSDTIKSAIQKADPIFKQETTLLLNKLEYLNTPQKLASTQNVQEILSKDLKAVVLQTAEEIKTLQHPNQNEISKQLDKLSLQIDHYQLISHLSNASSLYLPFSWDMLEDGNIQMRKSEDDKFYCDIDLKLKEYGELNIKMTLFEKNQLNLHIYSAHEEFKSIIKENIASLRSALIETNITPREIRIFEPKQKPKASPYTIVDDNLKIGFEIKA